MLVPTGQGTGLTTAVLGLFHALERQGIKVHFFKPIAQGSKDSDTRDRSIELIVRNICKCRNVEPGDIAARQKLIKQFDDEGIMATPANSSYNELVVEAGRLSILSGGREAEITYGDNAGVDLRKY